MPKIVYQLKKEDLSFEKLEVTADNWHRDNRDLRFDIEATGKNGFIANVQLPEEDAIALAKAILETVENWK